MKKQLSQQKENQDSLLSEYTKISQDVYSAIKSGTVALQIIESKENLNPFLKTVFQDLTNNYNLSEKDLEKPYHVQYRETKVFIFSDKEQYHFVYIKHLQRLILTTFNNIKYYAYLTQYQLSQSDLQKKEMYEWQQQFPQLTSIQNQKELNYDKLKNLTTYYETFDSSIPNISFHYNSDGSQAILFNLFCDKEIIQKVMNQKNDFNSLFQDSLTMHFLLIKDKNICLEDFDAKMQQYQNNSLPLSTYLSIKFEESKNHLNKLGVYKKKHLSYIGTIPNFRLKQDLVEIYECLDNDLEFDEEYQDQYCYCYFTQSNNPFLLEGLIVGPEDTPFEGIVYTLTIKIPQDYPNRPPDVYFNQNILHPNISEKGKICLDILNNKWSPALTIQKVLVSIVSLLYERNLDDVYNHYAKCLYIEDPIELKRQILQQAIFSGCKKVDINFKQISKLSAQPKRKNILQSDNVDEYDYTNNDEYTDNYDYEEDE